MKLTQKQKASAFAGIRRFLSGAHWEALNERRSALIAADIDSDEFRALQELASIRRDVFAPRPTVTVPTMLRKSATGWISFSERHPAVGQKVTVRWKPPYEEGETDVEWAGKDSIDWKHECQPDRWKPLA